MTWTSADFGGQDHPLKFGLFLAPYHDPRHSISLSIERDLEMVEVLDRYGYDQVWFGEHHSGGYETSPTPELMIAAAAQRTRRITLGTGVITLPFHHPLLVADRMAFLDHMTRGRCVFGVGPGQLPLDSHMLGLNYIDLRERMEQSLDAILDLFDSDEPINRETDWFVLRDASLHVQSFTKPRVPIAVAAAVSPSGPRLAGKHGLPLLSVGAVSESGLAAMVSTWDILSGRADEFGQTVDRRDWALVGFMHIAETEKQAREEVDYGIRSFFRWHHSVTPPQYALWDEDKDPSVDYMVDRINESGLGIVGTPDMAIAHIERIIKHTGGFGTFLTYFVDWANREASLRNFELFAREVIPHFDGSTRARVKSFDWTRSERPNITGTQKAAWDRAQAIHDASPSPA